MNWRLKNLCSVINKLIDKACPKAYSFQDREQLLLMTWSLKKWVSTISWPLNVLETTPPPPSQPHQSCSTSMMLPPQDFWLRSTQVSATRARSLLFRVFLMHLTAAWEQSLALDVQQVCCYQTSKKDLSSINFRIHFCRLQNCKDWTFQWLLVTTVKLLIYQKLSSFKMI